MLIILVKIMSIKVQNITKIFIKQKALDNVSFEINKGEITGFLGPNGAGKSTIMKIITGFIPQTSGEVFVDGMNITQNPIESRKIIGYLPENNPLYLDMYVKEFLQFMASIYKIPNKKQRVDEIIELVGLTREYKKTIGLLSKGYKQRVGLAHAIIHNPSVLILDEPTTGLDPNQIVEIREIIKNIGKEKTIMLSTHIMQEVEAICSRVIIIDKGKIVANDTETKIKEIPLSRIVVEFDRNVNIEQMTKALPFISKVDTIGANLYCLSIKSDKDVRENIFDYSIDNKLKILTLSKEENTIETAFRELTK